MTIYTFTINEIDGEFFINEDEDGFNTREDAIRAVEYHCETESIEYKITS